MLYANINEKDKFLKGIIFIIVLRHFESLRPLDIVTSNYDCSIILKVLLSEYSLLPLRKIHMDEN